MHFWSEIAAGADFSLYYCIDCSAPEPKDMEDADRTGASLVCTSTARDMGFSFYIFSAVGRAHAGNGLYIEIRLFGLGFGPECVALEET